MTIVILAMASQGVYGARTALAQEYNISRTFLYQMLASAVLCLQELFSSEQLEISLARLDLDSAIVLLRPEGNVSIASISEILRMQGYPHDSTGMISQRLKRFGGCLPNTLTAKPETKTFLLSDELFATGLPILVTIDPVSTAILRIELADNRQAETWKKHFQALKEHGFTAQGLASDRGEGIVKGYQAVHEALVWCSDHFHEFRGLVKLLGTLEKQAYAAIAEEAARQRVFDNARSEANCQKRWQQLEKASADCEEKIDRYQHVSDVLAMLFSALYFFDLKTGRPRKKAEAKAELLLLMELLDELRLSKRQQQTKSIRNHVDDICQCYQQVEDIHRQLAKKIPVESLNIIGLAWQHGHQSHRHKGKVRQHHQNERDFWLEIAEPLLGDMAKGLIAEAFEAFDGMVRASSLIEMVNSQIRPFLNECKGQITQEQLNLIMFYHNHRRYKSGKRKGKAPIELLTKTELTKNWLELLFESISQA